MDQYFFNQSSERLVGPTLQSLLNSSCSQTPPKEEFIVAQVHPLSKDPADQKLSTTLSPTGKVRPELPPWRGSDRHPTDTIRFNYLDNSSPIELTG